MREVRQDDVLQDLEQVLQAVAEPEQDLVEAAVPFQGGAAAVVATAKPDHKVQKQAAGPDAPAAVTDVHVQVAAAEFHVNTDAAAEAARDSRGRAEEAERIVPQKEAAAGVAVTVAAREEVHSAEAAGRVLRQRESTTHERAKAGQGFGLARAEEVRAPARFRDAEVGVPKPGIDHALSRPPDQRPLVLAPHSGRAM